VLHYATLCWNVVKIADGRFYTLQPAMGRVDSQLCMIKLASMPIMQARNT